MASKPDMRRPSRSESGDPLVSPRSSRAASFSSDRPASLAGSLTLPLPGDVSPPPMYLAVAAASQIVTDNHNSKVYELLPPEEAAALVENAVFSAEALALLNSFLDFLLYSFLSAANSTSLVAVKQAVLDILKTKLAREAIAAAEEELRDLMPEGEEDDLDILQNGQKAAVPFDLLKVWQRTRLRIMVYTRLGELEDEDEERYVQQENFGTDEHGQEVPPDVRLVSWAAAIFLTSVIEYIAEQTVIIGGQAAFARVLGKKKRAAQAGEDLDASALGRVTVEEFDVERIALNSTLGRLWRTWRKRLRTPTTPVIPGSRNPTAAASPTTSRPKTASADDSPTEQTSQKEPHEYVVSELDIASNIPLPMSDNDIEEIEAAEVSKQPGDLTDEGDVSEVPVTKKRPVSLYLTSKRALSTDASKRKSRPLSLPPPPRADFEIIREPDVGGDTFVTPTESPADRKDFGEAMQEQVNRDIKSVEPAPEAKLALSGQVSDSTDKKPATEPAQPEEAIEEDDFEDAVEEEEVVQVLPAKRMSIAIPSSPVELVRTPSLRTPSRTPSLRTPSPSTATRPFKDRSEPKTYLEDESEDEPAGAIGVARTSDVPVRAKAAVFSEPTIPEEASITTSPRHRVRSFDGHSQAGERRGAVRSSSAPLPPRSTPSPVEEPVKQKTPPRSESRSTYARGPTMEPLHEAPAPEAEYSAEPQSKKSYDGSVRSQLGQRRSSSRETSVSRHQAPDGLGIRTAPEDVTPPGSIHKAGLQRIPSSASRANSVTPSIPHSARGSDSSITRPRGLSGRMSEEDREREFDSLVQSDEIVKYTLTPQTMRDMDTYQPPLPPKSESSKSTSQASAYPRVATSANENRPYQYAQSAQGDAARSVQQSPHARPSRTSGSQGSNSRYAAREPRIQTETLRDFADFIRSTGPDRTPEPTPLRAASRSRASSSKGAESGGGHLRGLSRKISSRGSVNSGSHAHSASAPVDGPTARPRIHMEPRNPAAAGGNSADMIDFIRQGPPASHKDGQHRIPRTVAPFRSTVDSDEFSNLLGGGDLSFENGAQESAYGSTTSKQSTLTSANSRTDLLPGSNLTNSSSPAPVAKPILPDADMFSSPEPKIQRRRRRIKDPYAIDTDSEEEDEDLLTALPTPKARQEESLMDFLNSTEPPSADDKPAPFALSEETIRRARVQNAIHGGKPATMAGAGGGLQRTGSRTGGPGGQKPLPVGGGAATRPARAQTGTSDLADFLRNSGPPEPPAPRVPPPKEEKRSMASRIFGRRKTIESN